MGLLLRRDLLILNAYVGDGLNDKKRSGSSASYLMSMLYIKQNRRPAGSPIFVLSRIYTLYSIISTLEITKS